MAQEKITFLCVTFYFKGQDFMRSAKAQGHTVYLLTHTKHKDKPWPKEAIDEFFYMDDDTNTPVAMENMIKGLAWLLRTKHIDSIVALDDFDVEKAATMREEFRIPGMGLTTSRYFRDKLAMRIRAAEAGIRVPAFAALFHDAVINRFADNIPAPWLLKPRSEASAMGIQKVHSKQELWERIHALGDRRHTFLVEQFKPGAVYHSDSLSFKGELKFCWSSRYLNTPFEVAHGAGIFRSASMNQQGEDAIKLAGMTADVMRAFGMRHSASHTEWIKCHEDGEFYFLETSARVGGAHLAYMVEAASGVNIWWEWARIEAAAFLKQDYEIAPTRNEFAGILISLARTEHPDMSRFNAPEVITHINEPHHVAFIMRSPSEERIAKLLDEYAEVVYRDDHASAPLPDKPPH
jgi:biotin carboxylase